MSAATDLQADGVLAPPDIRVEEIGRVAGSRWTVGGCVEEAKGAVGLDAYEVRSWPGWYRPITVAMWA